MVSTNSYIFLKVPGNYINIVKYDFLVIRKILKKYSCKYLDAGVVFLEDKYENIIEKINNNKNCKNSVFLKEKIINRNNENIFNFFNCNLKFYENLPIKEMFIKYYDKFANLYCEIINDISRYKNVIIYIDKYEVLFSSLIIAKSLKIRNQDTKIICIGPYLSNIVFTIEEKNFLDTIYDYIIVEKNYSEIFKEIFRLDTNNLDQIGKRGCKNYINELENTLINIDEIEEVKYIKENFPIVTSYNCYFGKCKFCYESKIYNKKISVKKIEILLLEIEYLYNKFGIRNFSFKDNFIHENYLLEFVKKLLDKNIGINWSASTRVGEKLCSQENVELLNKAGCNKIFIGVESYSDKMLNLFNKQIKKNNIIKILTNLKKYNIKTHISILFGFPQETNEDRNITLEFLKQNLHLIDVVETNLYMINSEKLCPNIYNPDLIGFVNEVRMIIIKNNKIPK